MMKESQMHLETSDYQIWHVCLMQGRRIPIMARLVFLGVQDSMKFGMTWRRLHYLHGALVHHHGLGTKAKEKYLLMDGEYSALCTLL